MQEKIKEYLDKAVSLVYQVFWLCIIVIFFISLAVLYDNLGGYDTVGGTAVGILWLVLFLSPLITWIIGASERFARSSTFGFLKKIFRVSSKLFLMATFLSALITWLLYRPTRKSLSELLQDFINIVLG